MNGVIIAVIKRDVTIMKNEINFDNYITQYGIVQITGGKYKGRFGYYDDDGEDNAGHPRAIVYFGSILYNSKYVYINHKYINKNFTFNSLKERKNEIGLLLWKRIDIDKRVSLIEEKGLIDIEIISQLQNKIDFKISNNNLNFLSHSSLDKEIVVTLAMDLEKRGLKTWLDSFDILPGESIVKKIDEGLNGSDYILLFVSKNFLKSNWVFKEWETMLWDEMNSGVIKIIPIKLDDCKMPKLLQTKKYISISED